MFVISFLNLILLKVEKNLVLGDCLFEWAWNEECSAVFGANDMCYGEKKAYMNVIKENEDGGKNCFSEKYQYPNKICSSAPLTCKGLFIFAIDRHFLTAMDVKRFFFIYCR